MLKGKITREGLRYHAQVGAVTVDVTDDVQTLLESKVAEHERALAEMWAKHAEVMRRYAQIECIVLAGGAGMPTG